MNNILTIVDQKLTQFDFSQYLPRLNFFDDVDFSLLYDWLPGDITAVCGLLITFCVVMFVIGLIKKVIAL